MTDTLIAACLIASVLLQSFVLARGIRRAANRERAKRAAPNCVEIQRYRYYRRTDLHA